MTDCQHILDLKGDSRAYPCSDWYIHPNEGDTRLILGCNGEYALELSPESTNELIEYLVAWKKRTYKAGSR